MFSWFAPKCPLPLDEKTWIEYRFRRLVDLLGPDRLRSVDVLDPSITHIPGFPKGAPDVDQVLEWLCARLKIPPGLTAKVVPDSVLPRAAGLYIPEIRAIQLQASLLETPDRVLGTLIHEVLHDLLLQGGILTGHEGDHERMTDLAAVVVGLGIPLTNQTIRDETIRQGNWVSWRVERVGYLTAQEFGYAHAVFCHARGETLPAWSRSLRQDASETLQKGLKFLAKTGDLLVPVGPKAGCSRPSAASLGNDLRNGTPTRQLAALWEIADADHDSEELRRAALALLDSPEERIRCEVVALLSPSLERTEVPRVVESVLDESPLVQVQTLASLIETEACEEEIEVELTKRLPDLYGLVRGVSAGVRSSLVTCLARYCFEDERSRSLIEDAVQHADPSTADAAIAACVDLDLKSPLLLERLRERIREECYEANDDGLKPLLYALSRLTPNPKRELDQIFSSPEDLCYLDIARQNLPQGDVTGSVPESEAEHG